MRNKQTVIYAVGGTAVVGILAAIGMSIISLKAVSTENMAVQNELVGAIANLNQQVAEIKEDTIKPLYDEEFSQAVVRAIGEYGQAWQRQVTEEKLAQYKNAPSQPVRGQYLYGNAAARFTLVEFSDLECPYCKRFHATPKEIVDGSGGQVNWQWRHLPLDFHNPAASVQAHAAECVGELAGNRAFWVFLSDIFDHSAGNGQGTSELLRLATDLGVDAEDFKQCMTESRYEEKINEDVAMATSLGITGTPATILTDNKTGKTMPLNGAQPKQAVLSALRSLQQAENSTGDSGGGSDG